MKKQICSSSERRPSFFKVLIHYTTKLRLPPVFVRKFGKFLPETTKLRSISGQTWDVKLKEEIGDGDGETYLCFGGRGWAKFVRDLELKFGEFLAFFLNVSEATFDVSVFGTNFCERPMDVYKDADSEDFEFKNACDVDVDVVPDDCRRNCINIPESEVGPVIERPHFELLLTKKRNWRRCVPKKFIEAANLSGKSAVVMEYPPKKRYWAVNLARSGKSVTVCGPGWTDFRLQNGLVEGKTYSFQFNPTKNVIQVKEHN